MFIDLTRLGGVKIIRVRVEAIAYLDDAPTGCNVAMIGGETIRVNEDREEVERRCGGDAAPPVPKAAGKSQKVTKQASRSPRATKGSR